MQWSGDLLGAFAANVGGFTGESLCGSLAIGEGGEGFSDTELRGDKAVISSYFD
jgi:hypothetical protein